MLGIFNNRYWIQKYWYLKVKLLKIFNNRNNLLKKLENLVNIK